jgi:prevent-host-death family protein
VANIREFGSRDARKKLRELLDIIMTGDSDVLISSHGRGIAVLIPASDYFAVLDELDELRLGRLAEKLYSNYLEEPTCVKLYEDIRDKILED